MLILKAACWTFVASILLSGGIILWEAYNKSIEEAKLRKECQAVDEYINSVKKKGSDASNLEAMAALQMRMQKELTGCTQLGN